VESWTDFNLVDPYYIDVEFRCRLRRKTFHKGYLGLFWASYINAPENKSIYFRGFYPERDEVCWLAMSTHYHGHCSTIIARDDEPSLPFEKPDFEGLLFLTFSPLRYTEPFFFGRFNDMTLIFMFEKEEGLRISHGSSGGGFYRYDDYDNPAWDFQYIIGSPQTDTEYSYRWRLAYKRYLGRDDVAEEYHKWRSGLAGSS
jgi:hypothetical protein